jgi:predicted CopG family antitoxin
MTDDDNRKTITVHESVYDRLTDLKRGGESWGRTLDRLADLAENTISRREYGEEVDAIAERALREVEEREDVELSEIVHTEIDSHQWVIYSAHHADVLAHASTPDEWQHLVGDGDDWRDVLMGMAYAALRSDVWAAIHDKQDGGDE